MSHLEPVIAGYIVLVDDTSDDIDASFVQEIRFEVDNTTVSSATSIPAGSRIISAELNVITPYSNGTQISLGQSGSVSEFMAVGDNNPQSAGLYQEMQDMGAASTNPVLATVSEGASGGQSFAIVRYVVSPNN